jgi:hypothetical protein
MVLATGTQVAQIQMAIWTIEITESLFTIATTLMLFLTCTLATPI